MDTLFGLPAHPLLVHIPVVLVPLCAIAVVVMAVHRGMFARMSWVVLGLTGVALVATILAAEAGEALEESVKETSTLEGHTEAGDQFRLIMIGFFLVVAAMVVWDFLQERRNGAATVASAATPTTEGSNTPESTTKRGYAALGPVSVALRAIAVIAAVITTYFVVDVGHSGAKSSWGDVKISNEKNGGESGESGENGG